MRSREWRNLQQLDPRGANEFARKELRARSWRKQFRSNLHKIISLLDELSIKPANITCLKRTHFYSFLEPFINKRVCSNYLIGMQKGLIRFLMAYDRKEQVFVLGGHRLTIEPSEFDLIFGIPSGEKEVNMKSCSVAESSFGRRKFLNQTNVTALQLRAELEKSIKGTPRRDIEDTVRLMILHTIGCVMFVACTFSQYM